MLTERLPLKFTIILTAIIGVSGLTLIMPNLTRDEIWYTYYASCKLNPSCINYYFTDFDYHAFLFTPATILTYGVMSFFSENIIWYRSLNIVIFSIVISLMMSHTQFKTKRNYVNSSVISINFILCSALFIPNIEKLVFHARPDFISACFLGLGIFFCLHEILAPVNQKYKYNLFALSALFLSSNFYWTGLILCTPLIILSLYKIFKQKTFISRSILMSPPFVISVFFTTLCVSYYTINFDNFFVTLTSTAMKSQGNFSFATRTEVPNKDIIFILISIVTFHVFTYIFAKKNNAKKSNLYVVYFTLFLSIICLGSRSYELRHFYFLVVALNFVTLWIFLELTKSHAQKIFINLCILVSIVVGIHMTSARDSSPIPHANTTPKVELASFEHWDQSDEFIPIEAFLFLDHSSEKKICDLFKANNTVGFYLSYKNFKLLQRTISGFSCSKLIKVTNYEQTSRAKMYTGVIF